MERGLGCLEGCCKELWEVEGWGEWGGCGGGDEVYV